LKNLENLPAMWDTDRASNMTKERVYYKKDAQINLDITMPYVMEKGKISHAIKKHCLLCERYAARLLYQTED
jgi:hypothetical protein